MSVELRIRKLLNSQKKMQLIAEELLNYSAGEDVPAPDIAAITQFLIHSGLFLDAFRQYPRRFYEKKSIPWPHFLEILWQSQIEPPSEVIQALFEGASKLKKEEELVLNSRWMELDERFPSTRKRLWQAKISQLEELKASLLQKLEFLQNHRMLEEEQKVFQKFMQMFPEDEAIASKLSHFKERWAREVVNKKRDQLSESGYGDLELSLLSAEERELCDRLGPEAEKLALSHPQIAYDLALMFVFFESGMHALKLLKLAPESEAKDWLHLELLLDSGQHLEALECAENLEAKYLNSSETKFAIAYVKAKALKQLNQKARAAQILRSIVNLRPDYRSASTLLTEILEESV
jgi:hypothetical protein